MSVVIAANFTRTKEWVNPRTRQRERIITYPDGRREVIPLTGNTNIISQVESSNPQ